jgi:transcriptional regulator with XRE-family HTH domain
MTLKMLSNQISLPKDGYFCNRQQPFLTEVVYFVSMTDPSDTTVDLTALREAAGLTVRGLARELGINHATLLKWESSGRVAKAEFLVPMSSILGVSIEELLGQPKPRRTAAPGGKLGQVFREVSELPRRKQQRIVEVVEDMLTAQKAKAS